MNTPDQPTPRTNAAWAKTFESELNQFWSGNAANQMREECATLERELAETERLRFGADADRRRLRAEVERWKTVAAQMTAEREHNANEASRLRAQLAAIEEDGTEEHNAAVGLRQKLVAALDRAEKAEAALADWSILNLWGGTPEIIHEFVKGQQNRIHHCQDLEAELDSERARLDYLALNMGIVRVAEALNCDCNKTFPIRDAIDLAMKKETPTP
jgi:hypothetical protein